MTDDKKPDGVISFADYKGRKKEALAIPLTSEVIRDIKANKKLDAMLDSFVQNCKSEDNISPNITDEMIRNNLHNDLLKFRGILTFEPDPHLRQEVNHLFAGTNLLKAIFELKLQADALSEGKHDNDNVIRLPESLGNLLAKNNVATGFLSAAPLIVEAGDDDQKELYSRVFSVEFIEFIMEDKTLLSDIQKLAQKALDEGKGASR